MDNQADAALLPVLYLTQHLAEDLFLGLQISAPFGLESVWPAGTLSHFQAADTTIGAGGVVAGLQPVTSRIEVAAISPSIGIRFSTDWALVADLITTSSTR